MSVIAGDPHRIFIYIHCATCAKAQAAHRRGPRLLANRRLRRFRSGAVEKMTGDHPRNTGPMLSSLRCGAKTRSGKPCGSPAASGGKRCQMHGGAPGSGLPRQQERAEARPLYARSHRGTPATAGAEAAIAHADLRHRAIDLEPPCRCLGREGDRVRCAVVSIVARGLTSGQKRPRGPVEQPTLV